MCFSITHLFSWVIVDEEQIYYINKILEKFSFHCSIRPCLSLMAWFLTHVLDSLFLVQVLLGFLLLREFLVSGNKACWLMLELGENIPVGKVLESN